MTAITERTPDRQQFLVDVLITACEGGIGYWAFLDEYAIWENPNASSGEELVQKKDPQLRIFDFVGAEDLIPTDTSAGKFAGIVWSDAYWKAIIEDKGWEELPPEHCHTLNAEVIEAGLRRAWQQQLDQPGSYWAQLKIAELTHGRDGDYDTDQADQVVQLAIFGEVVYS